jgi:tRNA nucleotidyltransferase/poly(A) polymerase
MKIYKVGGYVRDQLMGLEPKDCDYVVVGSTPEEMLALNYEQVGKDFPVFLHSKSRDEYALARIERKTGVGYTGFDFDTANVTLEEDLFRRDLTINAMALDEDGNLIDPYNGVDDLKNKLLRHVSPHFKEDPVRILRIARFSARYDFSIAPETLSMMKEMVTNGEFDHLTGERVWKEFEKVLSEKYVSNFFNSLEDIGALNKIPGFSSINDKDFFEYIGEHHSKDSFMINLMHSFSQMSNNDLKKWKMPTELIQKITQFSLWKNNESFYSQMSVDEKLTFIQQNKALHGLDNAKNILYGVHAYQSWKNKTSFNIEQQYLALEQDIAKLKTVDYEVIVKQALLEKQKPNEVVKNIQLSLLKETVSPSKRKAI